MEQNQKLVRRIKRDIYGNWIWEDDDNENVVGKPPHERFSEEGEDSNKGEFKPNENREGTKSDEIKLDWKDYIALSIAALETVLLPLVIFVVIVLAILLAIALSSH